MRLGIAAAGARERLRELASRLWRTVRWAAALASRAAVNFIEDDGFDRSAAISYYSLFSFVPFMAILALLGSWILGSPNQLLNEILFGARLILPTLSPNAASRVLGFLPNQRSLVLVMLPVMLWTATYAASSVEGSINTILRTRESRRFLAAKLKSIALLGVGAVSLLVLPALQQSVNVISRFSDVELPPLAKMPLHTLVSEALIILAAFLAFAFALVYVPATRMPLKPSLGIAAVAAGIWQVARLILGHVLSATAHGNVLAGSFSAVIALLLWVYVTSIILLFAAELLALAVGRRAP